MNLKSLAWWSRPQPSYPASSFPVTHLTTLSSMLPMLHNQLNTFKTRLAISYATPISVPPFVFLPKFFTILLAGRRCSLVPSSF